MTPLLFSVWQTYIMVTLKCSLLVVLLCLSTCTSSSHSFIKATFYELYNVVPFNDSLLTTNSSGCFPTRYTVVCRNISQAKLSDGITGPTDILSGNLEQFFALSRYAEGSIGRLTIGFAAPVSVAVIYFFNSPTDYIGLPEIKVYKNINAPINYTFSNDNNLNQNDSQLRNITLEFSEKLIIVQIDFVFPNNSRINWFLISEVKFYNCTPPISPPINPVTFIDGTSTVVTLEPDNLQPSISLSCTVVNAGSFEWEWLYNGTHTSKNSRVWIGDATRTSTLTITQLSFTDEGKYTCLVNYQNNSNLLYKRRIHLQLKASLTSSSPTFVSDGVKVSCEMTGYLRPVIQWLTDATTSDQKYSIDILSGSINAISTKGLVTNSSISTLTILNPIEDNQTYTCALPGTDLKATITLNVSKLSTSKSSTSSVTPLFSDSSFLSSTPLVVPSSPLIVPSSLPDDTPSAVIVPFIITMVLASFAFILASAILLIIGIRIIRVRRGETVSPTKDKEDVNPIGMTSNAAYTVVVDCNETEAIYAEIEDIDEDYV